MAVSRLPISVLIMAQNEEMNIEYAIRSVIDDFDQIIVADSFSVDKTVEICRQYPQVEVYENRFEGWAEQRNWMLKNCNIRNEIVFFLDADEYVDEYFINELRNIIGNRVKFSAIYLKVHYIFLNTHLKHAYGHPRIKRIFKKEGLYFKGEGAREYANISTDIIEMKTKYIHHDRKPISSWIEKHNNNADREANLYIARKTAKMAPESAGISTDLKIKLWIRRQIWDRMPLFIRTFFYFIVRYLLQGGILDGRIGFIYCYLHAFWYQNLIDIKIIEISNRRR